MKSAIALLLVFLAVADARSLLGGHWGHGDPHDCYYKTLYSCDPKEKVECGGDWCLYPSLCATIEKEVDDPHAWIDPKEYDPSYITCEDPKLVCHEILTACGDPEDELFCKFNEKCVSKKVCKEDEFWKLVCEDVYDCVEFDPKVCKVVEHFVCVKRDPVIKAPGFFMGYEMAWLGDEAWKAGEKCGDTVCELGETCASCAVEICDDEIMPAEGEKCGIDAYCDPGAMCVETCDPPKKVIEVEICLDPKDPLYLKELWADGEECGDKWCKPIEECNVVEKKICAAGATIVVDPHEHEHDYGYGHEYGHGYEYGYEKKEWKDYDPDYYYDKPVVKPDPYEGGYKPDPYEPVYKPKDSASAASYATALDGAAATKTIAYATGNGKANAGALAASEDSAALSNSYAGDGKATTKAGAYGDKAKAAAIADFLGEHDD